MLRLGGFLGPYKSRVVLLLGMAAVSTLLALVPPTIQGEALDRFNKGTLTTEQLYPFIGLWVVVLVAMAVFQILNGRLMTFLGAHLASDLRTTTYRAIEHLQMTYFDKKPVGAIASRVTQDTDRVWFFLVDGLPFIIINGMMLLAVAVMIFSVNWMLAIAVLMPIPLVALISMKVWRRISNLFFRVSQKMARVHMHLNESLMGIRVVKAFAKEDDEFSRFETRSQELRNAHVRADQTWHTAFGVMTLCVTLGTVIHWAIGGTMMLNNQLSLGDFYRVQMYLGMVYGPLQWFASVNNWFSRAMAGAERIFEILDMTAEPTGIGAIEKKIEGRVEFRDVRFGYDKSNPVINGVSFDVKPGEMIGLVGHSGQENQRRLTWSVGFMSLIKVKL
ncbi:hypothetical protein CCB80_12370 [Armatimonadetes bacterium Uphvl-Ar1]|nr:hypothetical protein CCB80_12370 [Armatimonadetes bacterium Uphvl-Ar1]